MRTESTCLTWTKSTTRSAPASMPGIGSVGSEPSAWPGSWRETLRSSWGTSPWQEPTNRVLETRCAAATRPPSGSLHLLNVGQRPASIEIGLRGSVEAEVREPELARHGLYPVTLLPAGGRRPEIHIH